MSNNSSYLSLIQQVSGTKRHQLYPTDLTKRQLNNDSHRCAIQGVNNLVINHLSLENINGYAFYQSLMLQKLR